MDNGLEIGIHGDQVTKKLRNTELKHSGTDGDAKTGSTYCKS